MPALTSFFSRRGMCALPCRKLATRQLEGSECSRSDYEARATQLEQQREGWDAATQAEWRQWQQRHHEGEANWRREILEMQTNSTAGVTHLTPGEVLRQVGGAEDEPMVKVQNRRRKEFGRIVEELEFIAPDTNRKSGEGARSPGGRSPDASYVSASGFSLLGESLDWLPPIQNTSSFELERGKALMDAAREAFHPTDVVKKKPPSHDGTLLTQMHDMLHECPSLQRRLMAYLARINTRYKWDDTRKKRRSVAPKQCTLRIVSAQGLKKADAYDGSDPYVVVHLNGQLRWLTTLSRRCGTAIFRCWCRQAITEGAL